MANRLNQILDTMDIPPLRKDISKPENVRWLFRNISMRNGWHKDIQEARQLISQMLME